MDYEHFMSKALKLARQALEAGEFPVGCVIACGAEIVATGARRHTRGDLKNEIDHAEMVALKRLSELPEEIDSGQLVIYCTMEPCLMCLGAIILSGIRKIVYAYEDVMGGGTGCDLTALHPLYSDNHISIVANIMRNESVSLFKSYFADPGNDYWKGSLLARFTLSQ
jgi:tRNA(adenine34) deaminase